MAAESALNISAFSNGTDSNHTRVLLWENRNGVYYRPDGEWLYNMSRNSTVPWDDQEAMNSLFIQWFQLENLPGWWDIFKVFVVWILVVSTFLVCGPSFRLHAGTDPVAVAPVPSLAGGWHYDYSRGSSD